MKNKDLLVNVLLRILATFAASGLGVIGAGAIAGIPLWKACFHGWYRWSRLCRGRLVTLFPRRWETYSLMKLMTCLQQSRWQRVMQ
jgi:hypothetical protein